MATAPEPHPAPSVAARAGQAARRALPRLLYPGRLVDIPPIWREGRIATEYVRLVRDPVFQGKDVPHGDGRPIMLVPGFLAGDSSLNVMSDWLRRLGYYSELPGINFNINYTEIVIKALTLRLIEVFGWNARRVTLIGHSRGGLLAKIVAHRHPEMVEQVIGLGSPLADPFDVNPVTMAGVRVAQVLNFVRYGKGSTVERRALRDLEAPPRVPTTSIYTRSDGIVHWQACVRDDMRNIEVDSSHVGLAVNPEVYKVVARLLPWPARR